MNSNLAVAVVDGTEVAASMPSNVKSLVSKKGRTFGKEYVFAGTESASEIKARLKDGGYKGKELTRMVNEALASEKGARHVAILATVGELANRGFVADKAKVLKNSATISFVKAGDDEREVARREAARKEKVEAAASAAGVSAEQMALILAALK
jgi:hypothetical protein